jgi:hypothetical protein
MATVSADEIKAILQTAKSAFPGVSDEEKTAALTSAMKRIDEAFQVPSEDKRLSVQLTSELSKIFISVALAAIVAVGTLVQLGWNTFTRDHPYVLMFCFFVGLACFISMYAGVIAISRLARSGLTSEDRWFIDPHRWLLNVQALSGVCAIVFFVIALSISRESPGGSTGLIVSVPPSVTATIGGEVTIRGVWTQLAVEGPGNTKLEVAPASPGVAQSFTLRSIK